MNKYSEKILYDNKLTTPLVTIITVVFNAEDLIEETVVSVVNQSYKNIEYVVIDGFSKDNTLEIIEKYRKNIDCLVSEKDNGIYDAMNKGIELAQGDWIIFINAGDTFADENTLKKIFDFRRDLSQVDFIYGDVNLKTKHGLRLQKARNLDILWKGMVFCHQSLLVRSDLLKKRKFDLTYKIQSDYDHIFEHYQKKTKFLYIPIAFSNYLVDGFSDRYLLTRTFERWGIIRKYMNTFKVNIYYIRLLSRIIIKKVMR